MEEHLVICWAAAGLLPREGRGYRGHLHPTDGHGAGPAAPLLSPPAAKRPTWTSASCQSLLSPPENHLLPLEKCLSKLLCSCQPRGDRARPSPRLLTLPGAAEPRPLWVSVLLQLGWNLLFQSLSSSFSTQPLCGLRLAAGRGWGPLPRGGRASPNAHAQGKENAGN